jgi:integrase/recombinase XerC
VDEYLDHLRRRGLAEGTIQRQRRFFRRYSSALDPRQASAAEVTGWLDTCTLSPRSRYTYISILAGYYRWLQRMGHREDNPTEQLDRPRAGRLLPRPIPDEDLRLALKQADGRMTAWLSLAAYQGLRCFELAHLQREDFLDHLDPALLVVHGKGNKERVLPLNPEAWSAVLATELRRNGFVFRMKTGSRFREGTISSYIARYLHQLGIPFTAHNLRHWFGSTVYARTLDLRLTQELMGHAWPTTTAIYAAWSPTAAVEVVRGLHRL